MMNKSVFTALFTAAIIFSLLLKQDIFAGDLPYERDAANYEALVYIDGMPLITRIGCDNDGDINVGLRGFMQMMGYLVTWDDESKTIELTKSNDKITITIDKTECIKNGTGVKFDKPVFIGKHSSTSYLTQSFLRDVIGVEIISIDQQGKGRRIDGAVFKSIAVNSRKTFKETISNIELFSGVANIKVGGMKSGKTFKTYPDTEYFDVYGNKIGADACLYTGSVVTVVYKENDHRSTKNEFYSERIVNGYGMGRIDGKINSIDLENNMIAIETQDKLLYYLIVSGESAFSRQGEKCTMQDLEKGMPVNAAVSAVDMLASNSKLHLWKLEESH